MLAAIVLLFMYTRITLYQNPYLLAPHCTVHDSIFSQFLLCRCYVYMYLTTLLVSSNITCFRQNSINLWNTIP